jgi:rhodanese-related sulfurtransferase
LKHVDHPPHVDVRNGPEITASGIIEGAINIPLGELEARVGELKERKNIVVNCLSGIRSKIAFSVLTKYGI